MREKGREEKEGRREESKGSRSHKEKGGGRKGARVCGGGGGRGGDGQTLDKKERFKAKKQVGENQKEGEQKRIKVRRNTNEDGVIEIHASIS